MFKVFSQILIVVHRCNSVSNGFMKVSHPSTALRGKFEHLSLSEWIWIHSLQRQGSVYTRVFEPRPNIIRTSKLSSSTSMPAILLQYRVSTASIRTLGIQRCHSKNFVKEPYRPHNRFFLGWLESNLLPILLGDTKGALPQHDYAEITFCKKLKPSRAFGIPKPCFWPRGAAGISQHIPSALFSDPNRAPLGGLDVFTVSLPGLWWPITSTKKRKHRGLRTKHDKTIKCTVGTAQCYLSSHCPMATPAHFWRFV